MTDRAEQVLTEALERLVQNGTLSREQAAAVRAGFTAGIGTEPAGRRAGPGQPATPGGVPWTAILAEVGGYVGAAFVTAAAVALVGPGWDNFSQAGRVAILAVPAVLLLIAAVVVGRTVLENASGALGRLVGVLVLAGGGLLTGAAAVIAEDLDSQRWVPLVALLVWGIGYRLRPGVPLHLGTAVALLWTTLSLLNPDTQWLPSGLMLVLVGVGWAALTLHGLVPERALGIAVSGVLAFIGGEIVATSGTEHLGYLLLGLLAVAGLAGYIRTRELSALGVGAASLAVVVPQAVIDYTEGALGAAGALLVSGLSIVAASVLAARLRRTDSDPAESGPTELV